MNKDICKIKLAITTECNIDCKYCFVNKTNQQMGFNTAQKAIDLLLSSKGKNKLLSIYGGEPFLNFKLLEKIIPYAASQAQKLKKDLIISICTNGTLLTKEHLDFLKQHNIRLIISMVGNERDHNKFRKFINNKGSYRVIIKKLPLIFLYIPQRHLGVSFCIFPSLIDRMDNSFKHLINLGFNYVNFEIIRGYEKWSLAKIKRFVLELKKVIGYIFSKIPERNFIFLNPINWEIKYRSLTQSLVSHCPFNYELEVYPKGEIAFSPFLLNSPRRDKYIIGNINKSHLERFNDCRFNSKSSKCQRCKYDYFKDYDSDKGADEVYKLYHLLCLKASRRIQYYAYKIKSYKDYIREIKNKVCF